MTQVDSTPSLMQGMIVKAHSGFFTVHVDMSGQTYICKAAGKLTKGKHTEDALAVGDRVLFEIVKSEGHASGRIVIVLPRERVLARKDPIAGTNEQEIQQVIVSNLDCVVFVFSCAQP